MRNVLLVLALGVVLIAKSQPAPDHYNVKSFYDALNKGDSTSMMEFLDEELMVYHYEADTSYSFNLSQFITICPKFESGHFYEEFEINKVIDQPNSNIVEVEFYFVLDGVYDHCGRDIIYMKGDKISEIHSYTEDCEFVNIGSTKSAGWIQSWVSDLLDNWHKAAADADYDAYFNFMADDFYYLGTDPSERWSKEQFANFCKPHFDKGKAWTFIATERNYYFSDDYNTVWFDEKLDTWMEGCRGSGVLEFTKLTNGAGEHGDWGSWKLKHYNLTVTIENEKIQDFIKLRKEN